MGTIVAIVEADKNWGAHFPPPAIFTSPLTKILEGRGVSGSFVLVACEEQKEFDLIDDTFHVEGATSRSVLFSCKAEGFRRIHMRLDIQSLETPEPKDPAQPGDQLHDAIVHVRGILIEKAHIQQVLAEQKKEDEEKQMARKEPKPLTTEELGRRVIGAFADREIPCRELTALIRELEGWDLSQPVSHRVKPLIQNGLLEIHSGVRATTIYKTRKQKESSTSTSTALMVPNEVSPPTGYEKFQGWVVLREERKKLKKLIAFHQDQLMELEKELAKEPANVKEALDLHEYLHWQSTKNNE